MAILHIDQPHTLDRAQVEAAVTQWAAEAQSRYGLACARRDDDETVRVDFNRAGIEGVLTATPGRFVLEAKLGFLFSAFAPTIQAQIEANLQQLLARAGSEPNPAA